jgi:serine/threonine protein phosphatase PrpC
MTLGEQGALLVGADSMGGAAAGEIARTLAVAVEQEEIGGFKGGNES